ncbi:MAG: hypothetical protein C4527_21735 [Candidatus Omnitrophota bacterium]|nr:MAG: hypothetical protein C4527_21735 [Candidatus Omnitrophota bacterium]
MGKKWYKITRLSVLLGLMMSFIPSLQAQQLLNIDFSAAQGYVNGDMVAGQPAGAEYPWLDLRDTFGEATQIASLDPAEFFYLDNEKLVILQTGGGASWVIIMFPLQTTGILTLTWDWQYIGEANQSIDIGINLSDTANYSASITEGSLSGWGRQSTTARMAQAGVVDIYSRTAYSALEPFDYRDGKKIFMRYIVNLDTKTFDVYAQKEGEAEVAIGLDCGYRRGVLRGIDHLSIWESGSEITEAHIDNIVLTASTGGTYVNDWNLF